MICQEVGCVQEVIQNFFAGVSSQTNQTCTCGRVTVLKTLRFRNFSTLSFLPFSASPSLFYFPFLIFFRTSSFVSTLEENLWQVGMEWGIPFDVVEELAKNVTQFFDGEKIPNDPPTQYLNMCKVHGIFESSVRQCWRGAIKSQQ